MRNKIIALLIAAGITTGLGGFGTYAYFTSAAEVKGNVNITMGTLDVNAAWGTNSIQNKTWTSNSSEAVSTDGNDLAFTNVKPGDMFYRDITVSNDGTLQADTTIALSESFDSEKFDVDFNVSTIDGTTYLPETTDAAGNRRVEIRAMEPGATYNVRVNVIVKENLGNDFNNVSSQFEDNNFIKVNAHQVVR